MSHSKELALQFAYLIKVEFDVECHPHEKKAAFLDMHLRKHERDDSEGNNE